jgi:hypothetical protein
MYVRVRVNGVSEDAEPCYGRRERDERTVGAHPWMSVA